MSDDKRLVFIYFLKHNYISYTINNFMLVFYLNIVKIEISGFAFIVSVNNNSTQLQLECIRRYFTTKYLSFILILALVYSFSLFETFLYLAPKITNTIPYLTEIYMLSFMLIKMQIVAFYNLF